MACSTPFPAPTFHRMVPYRHPNPSHSVEEMARGIMVLLNFPWFYSILPYFPTCQVRVRFYQSCSPSSRSPSPSPPSPPPPLHPLPGPLLPLPCPLPPCQLFAKLLANFRTQWALLDLNCKGLSALGTAGPQPGTFRAQWAPLDLNLGPSELSEHRWTSTWDLPSSVSTAGPQRPDRMPEDMPARTPDSMSDRMPEDMPDKMPEDIYAR